jgi:hypothetical protein
VIGTGVRRHSVCSCRNAIGPCKYDLHGDRSCRVMLIAASSRTSSVPLICKLLAGPGGPPSPLEKYCGA